MRTLSLLVLLAGCHVPATAEDSTWKVKAPSAGAIAPHSRLHVAVEAVATDGHAVLEAPFIWYVDGEASTASDTRAAPAGSTPSG